MTTERANWKDVTPEDATDEELHLVHKIFGPKPVTMESDTWRRNMRSCAKEIREHVKMQLAAASEITEVLSGKSEVK